MPDWTPREDGKRYCAYCFRLLPVEQLETHEATYANRDENKRVIRWHVCRDGHACWAERHPEMK